MISKMNLCWPKSNGTKMKSSECGAAHDNMTGETEKAPRYTRLAHKPGTHTHTRTHTHLCKDNGRVGGRPFASQMRKTRVWKRRRRKKEERKEEEEERERGGGGALIRDTLHQQHEQMYTHS